ncbi:MAG: hypothetical protein RR740_00665 [Pseudomonas sp.]
MMSILIPGVALLVFLSWCWSELRRDLFGDKQFYSLKELQERDAAKAAKKAK